MIERLFKSILSLVKKGISVMRRLESESKHQFYSLGCISNMKEGQLFTT